VTAAGTVRASRAACTGAVLLGLLLAPATGRGEDYRARYRRAEEPQPLRLNLYELDAGMDAESVQEETTFRDTGTRSTYERWIIAPTVGMGLDGSIYHSRFLRFRLAGEGSYGVGKQKTDSGTAVESDEVSDVENLRGSIDLLPDKPVRAYAHGNYGRSFRDYDFFTRSTVETLGYGARVSQRADTVQSGLTYSHTEEDVLDSLVPSSSDQDLVGLDARHERADGNTALNYTYGETGYSGSDPESGNVSRDHTVGISDTERLGPQEKSTLQTSGSYNNRDASDDQSEQFWGNVNLQTEHRTNLRTRYDVQYGHFTGNGLESDSLSGNAELLHQLYESLQSSLQARASDSDTTAGDDSGYSRRYGGGIAEGYTKRLGSQHRLTADTSVFVDTVEESAAGRAVDERHEFPRPPATESFLLNLPNADAATIVVTDSGGVRRFARGIDYEIFPRGSRTEVRRIPGGGIVEGSTVLVSYSADGGGTGRYQSMTDTYGMRLELWKNLWALYARLTNNRNDAPVDLYALESELYTLGTDLNVRQARAGAEYEVYEADDTSYRSTRFTESAWIVPDPVSSLSLGLAQTFIEHEESNRSERDYRYTVRYRRALTRRLWLSMDAGLDMRRGEGVDQDMTVLRPEMTYRIGQTTLEAYYDYSESVYLDNEERTRQMFAAKLRRKF
jgi:hypothetical protein